MTSVSNWLNSKCGKICKWHNAKNTDILKQIMSALHVEKSFLKTWRSSSREERGIRNMQVLGRHDNKVVNVFPLLAQRTVRRILRTQNMFKTAWLTEKSSKGHAHTNENKTASTPWGIPYIINEVTRHFAARQFHSFQSYFQPEQGTAVEGHIQNLH